MLYSKGLAPESKSVQNITLAHLISNIHEVFGNKQLAVRVQVFYEFTYFLCWKFNFFFKKIALRIRKENGSQHAADFVEKYLDYKPQWPAYLIPNI